MDGDGTSMFPKSHAFSFPFSELHQMLTKTLRIMIASPFLSRWARTLRPTYKPGSQNPRRIPKPPLFERHHFPFRFLATSPINFFRMEETPMSSFGGAATAGISSSAGRREMVGDIDCFELSPSSVLKLQQGDITSWFVDGATDAIVNAANEKMLGGGGVDGAIHRAAGPELKIACFEVPEVRPGVRCPTGEARITPGFQLPVSRVIHTVGPIFGAVKNPEVLLRNAYRNSLVLAKENNIQYIAFPAISCGVYRYPYDDASKIALSAIKEFPSDFKEVHFVLFSDDTYRAWLESAIELM